MILTDEEMVSLIKKAPDDKAPLFSFGPGWAELVDSPENEWAVNLLKEIRLKEGK